MSESEVREGPSTGLDQAANGSQAGAESEEAPQVNCPYCDNWIPDEKVATGLCPSCFNALPSELDACFGPRARRAPR